MVASEPHHTPSLLYSAKRLELVIRARLDDMLRGSGVTTLQYTALTVLEHRDGVTAAQLARDSFVTPQSMSDMLRALEANSLISRSANPASRRELLVHLTERGVALLEKFAPKAKAIEDQMTHGMDATAAQTFRTDLTTGWSNLRK